MLPDRLNLHAARLAKSAFREHSAVLRRFLMSRVGNVNDIDDLVQEVFTRLLRVRDTELVRDPLAYLFGIAANVAREFLQRRYQDSVLFDSDVADRTPAGAERLMDGGIAERLELGDQLNRALIKLPPTHRLVILLVKRDGLSYAEASRTTGLSVHTIEKYLVEARALLRLILTGKERRP
jgi:RNA polymerase sigma-70 factor (ECF subfamily)